MKVYLVSIQYIPNITGGGGIVVRDLSLELAKAGDNVTVLTLGLKDKAEERMELFDGAKKYFVKVKRFFTSDSNMVLNPYEGSKRDEFKRFEEFTEQIFKYLRDKDGIIHLHGHYIVPALAKSIKEKGKKNPTFISFSGLESLALEAKEIRDDYVLNYIKKREEEGLKYCDYAIVNSKIIKEQLKEMYPNSFFEKKVLIIPNYVSNELIYSKKFSYEELMKIKQKYNIKNNDKLIYHLGRYDKVKGIEYLIEAMGIISSQYNSNIVLLLVGFLEEKEREYYNYLTTLADKIMKRCPNIEITFVSRIIDMYDRIGLMDYCSFFVTPAIIEPFGLTTLEAWVRGKAVIRSDNEGSRYLFNIKRKIKAPFEKKDKGIIVNFNSNRTENLAAAILYLLKNPDKTKKMGKVGQKTAFKKYSWKRPINIYRKLYQSIKI